MEIKNNYWLNRIKRRKEFEAEKNKLVDLENTVVSLLSDHIQNPSDKIIRNKLRAAIKEFVRASSDTRTIQRLIAFSSTL
jgi:hypothetical protein